MENQKRILVIDDNKDTVSLLEDFLGDNGFSVAVAMNGKEGLQRIIDGRPDLIILDLYLPDIMGSDICSQIRNNPATRDIPIILCTSHQISFGEKMKGFRAGVDDYLIRPFELAELLARIQAVLRRSQLRPKTELLADIQTILSQPKASKPAAPLLPEKPLFSEESKPMPAIFPLPASSSAPIRKKTAQPLEIIKRLWQILNHPGDVFRVPKYNHDFFMSILLVIGTPIIASLAKISEKTGGFDGWIGYFSLGIITNLIMWFATAGMLHLSLPFLGMNLSMRRSLSIAGIAWAARFLGAIFSALYGALGQIGVSVDPNHFTAGLDVFFNISSSPWVSILGHVSVFDFWCSWIILTAVWIITDSEKKKWTPISILIGMTCLLFGALTHY